MKVITVHAHDDAGFEARLQVALDLARAFGGHVTIVYAIPVDAGMPGDLYGATFASMMPVWREMAEALRKRTEADLANEDVPFEWIEGAGTPSSVLLRHSVLSDVIVVGAAEPQFSSRGPSETVGDLVLHARCPVLVVPEDRGRFDVRCPVLVAWDGSPEASRALRMALPLLAMSSKVTLACVREREGETDLYDLPPLRGAEYLSRHGIGCELVELPREGRRVAEVLRDAAATRKAGAIVMGAYGHMRLTERIFGGATRDMLTGVEVPLVMAH
ncbi:universal stress protein [Parerythrobacter aurantius]|uniref:universal stress protein n=1 Tax=Parerythrobacter aurantius TaxID=3127706 RepID=UPI00324F740F